MGDKEGVCEQEEEGAHSGWSCWWFWAGPVSLGQLLRWKHYCAWLWIHVKDLICAGLDSPKRSCLCSPPATATTAAAKRSRCQQLLCCDPGQGRALCPAASSLQHLPQKASWWGLRGRILGVPKASAHGCTSLAYTHALESGWDRW